MSEYRFFKPSLAVPALAEHDLAWIIACHEAGHGIAAYHLKFPVLGLVLHDRPGGRLEPDDAAIAVAWKYMPAYLASAELPLISIGAMLRMGWAVNRIVQGADAAKENEYSSSDIEQINKLFTDHKVGPKHITVLNDKIWERCKQIVALPRFQEALVALANELIRARRFDADQIAAIIEVAVGNSLSSGKVSRPPEDYIRRDAFYLWKESNEEKNNSLYHWLTAEKGLRFAFANAH